MIIYQPLHSFIIILFIHIQNLNINFKMFLLSKYVLVQILIEMTSIQSDSQERHDDMSSLATLIFSYNDRLQKFETMPICTLQCQKLTITQHPFEKLLLFSAAIRTLFSFSNMLKMYISLLKTSHFSK